MMIIIDVPIKYLIGGIMDIEKVQSIISKINQENKHRTSKRKRYSANLKQEIVNFVDQNKIATSNAAQIFSIGHSTIEKWKANQKKEFHQIKVSTPTRPYKKRKPKSLNIDAIKMNQIVLIILTAVLISELLFLHLNV